MTAPPNNPALDVVAGSDAPAGPPAEAAPGLKKRAINAGYWTTLSFVFDKGLAFVSNIVLVYLSLSQEDFGIVLLVGSVITGLQMFSDVGITPSLIQNKREDPAFYNTAWTIQVVRGVFLWLVACLLAYPLSRLFEGGEALLWLLPVAAFTSVFNGFRSTAWATANRRLDVKSMAVVTSVTSVLRVLVMWTVAYFYPSPWALVAGFLVGAAVTCVLSHRLIDDVKNRFCFERKAFDSLVRYGKWLFLSTVVTFWAAQIDKFLFASLLSFSALGLYAIALRFSELGPMFFKKMGGWVGFPALSDVYRRDPQQFGSVLLRMRRVLTLPINALLLMMIALGPAAMQLFYARSPSPGFIEAGWIIQVLCFNSLAGMTTTCYGQVFMAMGKTKYNLLSVLAQLVIVTAATLAGYRLAGETGFVLGIGVSQWLKYVFDAAMAKRCGCWQRKFDASVLIVCGLLAWGCVWFSQWLAEAVML